MCGPLDSELYEDVRMLIEFNNEARNRGKFKPACMICHGLLEYLANMSSGEFGLLAKKLLKAGEKTSICDAPCIDTDLAFGYCIGLYQIPQAKQAFERYVERHPYGSRGVQNELE